jgi:hypothetical protein
MHIDQADIAPANWDDYFGIDSDLDLSKIAALHRENAGIALCFAVPSIQKAARAHSDMPKLPTFVAARFANVTYPFPDARG